MSIFNLFKKEKNTVGTFLPPVFEQQVLPSEPAAENVVDERSKKIDNKTLTVSYATGWPIDVIYGYLHKNYEEKGFNDAMVKGDLTFRDLNMAIIRNKILMVFREINLNYDVMRRDLETRIETCTTAGLLTTLSELEKQIAIINAHKAELAQLEQDFRNNANEASVPLQSYDCGFLRGVATIAMSATGSAVKMPEFVAMPTPSQNRVTA